MSNLEKAYLKLLKKQETTGQPFYDKLNQLKNFYLPICDKIYNYYSNINRTLIIGLSGGQGSGKSTIAQILKIILQHKFNLNVVNFSIDDFYKTSSTRKKMSKSLHPLFKVRGVPGTHDSKMLYKIIKDLKAKRFHLIKIPKFDKSKDDRSNKKYWQKIKKKPNIIIFEGWCVGAKPQFNKDLIEPINTLEKNYDNKLTWRKKVNNELRTNYKKVFNLIDKSIYLKVPSFKYVLKWRLLQEKKLKYKTKSKTMNDREVKRFIMFYERITKGMLKNYKSNDIVIKIDNKHKICSINY
tara:strand:+ start:215 stop:1102 length:888 start_codon:yes stop_codon:yes gene_type:complete